MTPGVAASRLRAGRAGPSRRRCVALQRAHGGLGRRAETRRCPRRSRSPPGGRVPDRRRAAPARDHAGPSARIRAPTPLGPPILCAESVTRSAPNALISKGIFPKRLDRVDMQQAARLMYDLSGFTLPAEWRRFRCWRASSRPAPGRPLASSRAADRGRADPNG